MASSPTLMECFVNSLFKYSYMNRDASTPCSGNALRAHFYQPFGETRGGPKLTTWGISKHGNKEVGLGNPQCDHLSANNIWWPFNDCTGVGSVKEVHYKLCVTFLVTA